MPYVCTIIGPPAWLIWGWGAAPVFLVFTLALAVVIAATLLLGSRFSSQLVFRGGLSLAAVVWVIAGFLAWAAPF
jgi:hypothetical protein